jgi:hypothetical protein
VDIVNPEVVSEIEIEPAETVGILILPVDREPERLDSERPVMG